jgi:hypothetical protein
MINRDTDLILSKFLSFNGLEVRSIWYVWKDGCLAEIVLSFDNESIVFEAESEYDSVGINIVQRSQMDSLLASAIAAPPMWNKYVGQRFGWGWITINQQNVLDGVILSFNGIFPNLLLNVAASSIRVHEVSDASI